MIWTEGRCVWGLVDVWGGFGGWLAVHFILMTERLAVVRLWLRFSDEWYLFPAVEFVVWVLCMWGERVLDSLHSLNTRKQENTLSLSECCPVGAGCLELGKLRVCSSHCFVCFMLVHEEWELCSSCFLSLDKNPVYPFFSTSLFLHRMLLLRRTPDPFPYNNIPSLSLHQRLTNLSLSFPASSSFDLLASSSLSPSFFLLHRRSERRNKKKAEDLKRRRKNSDAHMILSLRNIHRACCWTGFRQASDACSSC